MGDGVLRIVLVAGGGAVGCLLRYGAETLTPGGRAGATLLVNVLGCLAMGVLGRYVAEQGQAREHVRLALGVGLLGGLTTFSGFALNTSELARGSGVAALAYAAGTNILCLAAFWAGASLAGRHTLGA